MPSFAPRAEVQRTGGRVAARSGCAVTRRSVMFAGLGVFIFAAAMSSSAWMRAFIDIEVNGGGGFATPAVLEQRPVSTAVTAASPARPAAAAAAALNAVAVPLPLPSAAASSVCALWKCSCQELANALRISHRAKEFGAAKGHPGAVRWWLENSCRANAQTKVPRGLTASILARLSVWMQQRDAPTPLAMAAPSAKVAWSSPAWVVERRWLAAEAGHAVPSFASEDAVHVMVVAGDFCASAAHCEATTGSEPAELAEEFLQGRYRVWVTVTSMLRTLLATVSEGRVMFCCCCDGECRAVIQRSERERKEEHFRTFRFLLPTAKLTPSPPLPPLGTRKTRRHPRCAVNERACRRYLRLVEKHHRHRNFKSRVACHHHSPRPRHSSV